MATGKAVIEVGKNKPIAAPETKNPTWMRWNNYGVALLDAKQHDSALEAFSMVINWLLRMRMVTPTGRSRRSTGRSTPRPNTIWRRHLSLRRECESVVLPRAGGTE